MRIFYRSETLDAEQEALSNEGHRLLQVTRSSFLRRETLPRSKFIRLRAILRRQGDPLV